MRVTIQWADLTLQVEGDYEPSDTSVGIMSACFIPYAVHCQGARQWAVEAVESAMEEIADLCAAQYEEDCEQFHTEARIDRWESWQ